MKICTHHLFVGNEGLFLICPILPSILVHFQGRSSSSLVGKFVGLKGNSRRCNEYALVAGTNQQLLKTASVHVLTRMHAF